MANRRHIPQVYEGHSTPAAGMTSYGFLPAAHHSVDPLHREILEGKLVSQAAEIEQLVTDNHTLASTHVTSKQDISAVHEEIEKLRDHVRSVRTESDIQIRVILDKMAKKEGDVQASDSIKNDLQQSINEAQNLVTITQELDAKLKPATEELEKTRLEFKKLPEVRSELENLQQDHQQLRETFEFEKGKNIAKFEQMKLLETNVVAKATEVERLRTELLNAERRVKDMAPKRFVDRRGRRSRLNSPPRAKISLGKKKSTAGSSGGDSIPVARPLSSVTLVTDEGGVLDTLETLVTRVTSKKKGPAADKTVEKTADEAAGNKRQRTEKSPTPAIGSGMADASILSRLGNLTPVEMDLSKLSSTQLAERLGRDLSEASRIGAILHGQALLATEATRLKTVVDQRLKEVDDLSTELKKAKEVLAKAKTERTALLKTVMDQKEKIIGLEARANDPDAAINHFFREVVPGIEFIRKMRTNMVGDELIWSFGHWAYNSGQKDMRDRAERNMREALEGEDLDLVLTTLPTAVPDPGLDPYDPEIELVGPSGVAAEGSTGKEAARPTDAEAVKK